MSGPMINTPPYLIVEMNRPGTDQSFVALTSFDKKLGRYAADSVTVSQPLRPLTSKDVTSVPVRRFVADGLREKLLAANPDLDRIKSVRAWAGLAKNRRPAASKIEKPTPELLGEARLVMRLERLVGGQCVKAMARAMGIEYRDALRWACAIRKMRGA